MNRREMLRALLGGAAVAADPDRLLFEPGRKLISIPSILGFRPVRLTVAEWAHAERMARMMQMLREGVPGDIRIVNDFRGLCWLQNAVRPMYLHDRQHLKTFIDQRFGAPWEDDE